MHYKRNTLTILYLILSFLVFIAHLKEVKDSKETNEKKELKETNEKKESKDEHDSKGKKESAESKEVKDKKVKNENEKKDKTKEVVTSDEKNEKKDKKSKKKNKKESGESKSLESGETTVEANITETTTEDPEKELKNQDWEVWCKLQPNGNDCSGRNFKITRFYYDTLLEDCKTFHYGRCINAFNNFETISECHEACREPGIKPLKKMDFTEKILCRLQPSFGLGFEYHPMFYFDINKKSCVGFSYSGLGGNGNRFHSSHECSSTCLKLMESELSIL